MATRQELDMRRAKRIVKRIAKRFDISIEDAKQFYFDRKKAKLNGVRLPFYKWKKKNLNFADTMDGNEVEEGDFDNFFSRKRRKKIARKIRGISRGAKKTFGRVNRGLLTGGLSELKKRRVRKVRRHKGLLKKLSNPMFMANPRNAVKVKNKMADLMKSINRNDKRAIKYAQAGIRGDAYSGGRGRPNMFGATSNQGMFNAPFGFDGADETFLNASGGGIMDKVKKNKWLIIGGAVAFLFLTPMGKKLIKG